MLHRIKKENDMHAGKWNGLGGKFEPHETPEECAIREIYEESGLKADSLNLKGVITFPEFSKGEDWYVFVFVVNEFHGELIESNEGELHWIDDDKLLGLNLWDGDEIFIKWLDKKEFFSAMFHYKNGLLEKHSEYFY